MKIFDKKGIRSLKIASVAFLLVMGLIGANLKYKPVREALDGLVLTDKKDNAYIIKYSSFGSFKLYKFDLENMRLIDD